MPIIWRVNFIDAASGIVTLSKWPLALFYNTFIIVLYMYRALYARYM